MTEVINQTEGRLGQAQGMVLNLFLKRIWDFGPNLEFGHLLDTQSYLAIPNPKSFGKLITFSLIM